MKRRYFTAVFVPMLLLALAISSMAQKVAVPMPPVAPLDLTKAASAGSLPIQIVVLLTLLSFIPAILISMTCFTRLIVVFHFLLQALGTQEAPSNQVLIGLALFLTFFVMSPALTRSVLAVIGKSTTAER